MIKIIELERRVCVGCFLWQKRYLEIPKQITKKDTYTRSKNVILRVFWSALRTVLPN